jgi:hypothetical protein
VLVRNVADGHISAALPMVVVEDGDDRVVLWLRAGTPIRWLGVVPLPAWVDAGRPLLAKEWDDNDRLSIWLRGASHTVSLFWRARDGVFRGWYVDAVEPMIETALGWDACDQELDVVVSPDLSSWWWKDEAELDERVDRGFISRARAEELRAELVEVIADIEAGRGVFAEPWPSWRPDPSWAIPSLPERWDAL